MTGFFGAKTFEKLGGIFGGIFQKASKVVFQGLNKPPAFTGKGFPGVGWVVEIRSTTLTLCPWKIRPT